MNRRSSQARGPMERLSAAGGVVYRRVADGFEVVLVGRTTPLLWVLPKGTPNQGETVEQTALREVTEETGLEVAIIRSLGDIRYWFTRPQDGVRVSKTVYHFLMEPTGGDTSQHDAEFDRVQWFPLEEALRVMTYPNEASVVERAAAALTELGAVAEASLPPRQTGRA